MLLGNFYEVILKDICLLQWHLSYEYSYVYIYTTVNCVLTKKTFQHEQQVALITPDNHRRRLRQRLCKFSFQIDSIKNSLTFSLFPPHLHIQEKRNSCKAESFLFRFCFPFVWFFFHCAMQSVLVFRTEKPSVMITAKCKSVLEEELLIINQICHMWDLCLMMTIRPTSTTPPSSLITFH